MNEEIKKILLQSVKVLRSSGGMENKEVKPVIVNIERLIRTRRTSNSKVKKA